MKQVKEKNGAIFETVHKRKEGTTFPVEVSSRVISLDENKLVFSFIRDITERKKLEAQLLQSQKMEAIGQLAGGIAHDFNNILTAMIGYAHILQIRMNETDPLKTYADHILSLSDKAANLTQSLLAFSRKQVTNPSR